MKLLNGVALVTGAGMLCARVEPKRSNCKSATLHNHSHVPQKTNVRVSEQDPESGVQLRFVAPRLDAGPSP